MEEVRIKSAREQVADVLRKAIFHQEFSVGQILSQEEIAQRLGVSRMPVREAFQILEREGLLDLQNHRRAVVRGFTVEDVRDHYSIRSLLEAEAAARASRDELSYEAIMVVHKEVERAVEQNDLDLYVEANESFHREIWDASGSRRLAKFLSQLWNGLPPHLPQLLPTQMKKSIVEHNEIIHGIVNGREDWARNAMMQHVDRSLNDFLMSYPDLYE